MSGDIEGTKRVRDTLDFTLKPLLDGFVEANMKGNFGNKWLHYTSRASGQGSNDPLDVYGLLKTILDNWGEVFGEKFERKNTHKARRLVSQLFDARNATAHLSLPLSDAEVLSHLNAMVDFATLLKAPAPLMAKLKAAYDAQRGSGTAPAAPAPVAAPAAPAPTLDLPPPAGAEPSTGKALKPWIEVALPHQDVIENRTKQSEFAADLFAVDAGHAEGNYASPTQFFQITYLTEGLKRVLTTAAQRLAGMGGDPVIGLQTAFGGGKTHTMLALYHLASFARDGNDPRNLVGIGDVLDKAGVKTLPKPEVAVFVGSGMGPDVSLKLNKGPRVHTVWGYLAWRLAGEPGLQLMQEAEVARTSPGSALLVELFKLAGPSLILLDELTMFARQLEDARFEAFLSFIQSLTEAAKMAPGVVIVGSLPESNAEAGGDKGVAALRRMEQVFGRVQSPWLPASGDETYGIIRRRLFQPLDADGEKAREETVKAFVDLYRKNPAEFPPEAREKRYEELLRLSYPIHPELFDRLSKDWATLDRFQRTRGVLRFLANIVGVLWHSETRDPLITPARVPVANERVRASVLYPLDPAFGAVVDREVDGEGSLPRMLELNPTRRISQARAASRAARAVFLCTAPTVGQGNRGVTVQGLRLACAEPGDQLAIFGEALRELTERAAYLYEETGRYWFATQPTLNRLADDRARAFEPHEVDAEIVAMLNEEARTSGGFHRVFPPSDEPTNIDEAPILSLAILGPAAAHVGRTAGKSPATDLVTDVLTRCRSSQRKYRNTLMFVAADEAQLGTARDVTRKSLAWALIVGDNRLMKDQLSQGQAADAQEKARTNKEAARRAVRTAWSHILYAIKTPDTAPGKAFDLDHLGLSSKDRIAIPAAVYEKAKADDIVKEKLGSETLGLKLKELWPTDTPHLSIADLSDWFSAHAYLPKLKDRVVLDLAIRELVAKFDAPFAYADRFDAVHGIYEGLNYERTAPELLAAQGLLVQAEAAKRQLAATAAPATLVADPAFGSAAPKSTTPGATIASPNPAGPARPHRFYGSVEIDTSNRPVRSFESIVTSVVMELLRNPGAKVKLTLEIEAEAPGGFDDADVGVVRDNTKQLKFTPGSTGFSD